ncbi:MAG TPA: ATP synthase F0 subunit A [Caldithrix abyssi]|uniref:ATP synthase subunit a n=1 Tax=Caldithrix abyssi TaxID=187145 RepID=A0A7V5PMW7_CALAY|nr:ATP synthase F0 subunit A [Caldithrix abyssi]
MALLEHTEAVADSVAEHGENIGAWIQHHLMNGPEWPILPGVHIHLPHIPPIHFLGMTIDLSIGNHVVMLWIAGLITILLFKFAYKKEDNVPKGFGALLEMLVLFIRDEVAIANMGEKEGPRFTPLLTAMFFFVLINNLMGLIPLFSTATGNVNVTAAMALVTFFATQIYGVLEQGLFGYYKNLVPHGVPFYLWPLMFVIEIMGLIAKHVALTIRLFANMVAGHIVLFAFLGLIIMFKTYWVSPVSVGFGVFVYFLELLVAFIQAYIFTVLSALFIGMSVNPEH